MLPVFPTVKPVIVEAMVTFASVCSAVKLVPKGSITTLPLPANAVATLVVGLVLVPASPPTSRPTVRVVAPPELNVTNSVAEVRSPETWIFPPAVTVEVAQPRESNELVVAGDLPKMSTSPPAEIRTPKKRTPLRFSDAARWLASP